MVRIPSFSRRSDEATRDENADGRIDERDDRIVASDNADRSATRHQVDDRTAEYRRRHDLDTPQLDDRQAAAASRAAVPTATEERYADRTADVAPAMPRPRASGLAMLSLIFGVAGALFVLTGTLAGYGIALGGLAIVLALGGISATSRFHVAGRSDAMLGLLLGLGAVVVGVLAVSGALPWLSPDTDRVGWLRDWLDTNIVNRF